MKLIMVTTIMFLSYGLQTVFAQCKTNIKPSSNKSLSYQERSDNRCEGFYTAMVGSSNMEVVSFTRGNFVFAADPQEVITIDASEKVPGKLNITALGIPKDLFYRMDAQLSADVPAQVWKASDVLVKNPRTQLSRNIGVLGYYELENRKVYTPLSTSTKVAQYQSNGQPIIKIICNSRVTDVRYTLDNGEEVRLSTSRRNYPSGMPIQIKLPKELKGLHTIEIKARKYNSTQWVTKRLDVKV